MAKSKSILLGHTKQIQVKWDGIWKFTIIKKSTIFVSFELEL